MDPWLTELISPLGGVIGSLEQLAARGSRSGDTITRARLGAVGALGQTGAPGAASDGPVRVGAELDGFGADPDPAVAARTAVVRGLARYAAAVADPRGWITATARELADDAIDLNDLAGCSDTELASDACRVTRWDPAAPVRWVRGWSLVSGRELWVPAVMAHTLTPIGSGERFRPPSLTGLAGAETVERALLAACRDLIGSDAAAIAWLQRLALRRLHPAQLGPEVARALGADADRHRASLWDWTSDLGVPVVAAVLAPAQTGAAVSVGCAAALPEAALAALRALSITRATRAPDAAALPGRALEHLWRSEPAPCRRWHARSADLAATVRLLAREGDVVAVDLTPVDLTLSAIRVVRVVAPALMPAPVKLGARHLAGRRLYDVPPRLGSPARREPQLNPWPLPLG